LKIFIKFKFGVVLIKRRVIQIANSTQLISLPRKWSLKYGVKKGDELEIEEKDNSLIIQTEKGLSLSRIEINVKGKEQIIHRLLSSLYRSGFDEINITYEKSSELELIQSTINKELIGFEIVEERRENIIIKQVSSIDYSEFNNMLKRVFMFILSTAEETLEALKKNDENSLNNLVFRDLTINKLTNYCRRSLNKKESSFKHIGPGYVIIEILEKISDGYRDLCKYASKNRKEIKGQLVETLAEINILLRDAQKLFYNFRIDEFGIFLSRKERLSNSIYNKLKESKKDQNIILVHLNSIVNDIFYLNGPLAINGLS